MQPAAETMARVLMEVEARPAEIPLISNVLAEPVSDEKEIIKRLVEQVTGTVRWRETMNYLNDRSVTDVYELGAGKVLSGLFKRSFKEFMPLPYARRRTLKNWPKTCNNTTLIKKETRYV